jgi:hypothetical protein
MEEGWGKIKKNKDSNTTETMVRKQTAQKNRARKSTAIARPGNFGPVSAINTAPVSVGNSVRGSRPRIMQTTNGARVVGRDFAFALSSTASAITNWELIGGMPITPCALPSSVLRNYCQMFQKFKVNKIVVHYITSSPTSQAGDVLFYYERDAFAPMCDYTNSNFLPFVLSDPNTVIGPQWTNHSMLVTPTADWKTTLFGNQSDLNEDRAGTIFMFSKTNAANSPGYVLIDYDISFKELSVNPRAGTLPIARAQSSFVCLTAPSTLTANSIGIWTITSGKNVANTTSVAPTGASLGDIYKCRLQITSSTLVNAAWSGSVTPTVSNLVQYGGTNKAITLDDGATFYVIFYTATNWYLYASLEEAVSITNALEWQTGITSAVVNICAEMQFVRNVNELTQSSY